MPAVAPAAARPAVPAGGVDGRRAARRPADAGARAAEALDAPGADAVDLFARAIEAHPADPRLLALAASAAQKAGRLDAAERWYAKAVALYPDFPAANHNLAVLLARIPARRAEAVSPLRRAIAADPHYTRARLTLASVLAALGETAEARALAAWVRDNDIELRDEAERVLYRMAGNAGRTK